MRYALSIWLALLACAVPARLAAASDAVMLSTGFDDADGWEHHNWGDWTQSDMYGTWTGRAVRANNIGFHFGERSITFTSAPPSYLVLPALDHPGRILFDTRTRTNTGANQVHIELFDPVRGEWRVMDRLIQNDMVWTRKAAVVNYLGTGALVRIRAEPVNLFHYIDNLEVHEAIPAPSLPYREDFEEGFGIWSPMQEGEFEWWRNQGYTESGMHPDQTTGPSAGYGGTGFYVYTEASWPRVEGEQAMLLATFDFRAVNHPELKFRYHMCGMHIGSLVVEVDAGAGWTPVFSRAGQQHAEETTPWSTATASLAEYAGMNNVRIRFRGVTGPGWAGDMAIDAVEVYDADPLSWEGISFMSGGHQPWFLQQAYTHEADWAWRSGPITNASGGQHSLLQTVVEGPATVSFNWKVDSEGGWDYFEFHINDEQEIRESGTNRPWEVFQRDVGPGSHTLRWIYDKDPIISHGLDSAFLDTIQVHTHRADMPVEMNFASWEGAWYRRSEEGGGAWTRNAGSTPTASTGPTNAVSGSHYIYTDAAALGSGKEALLEGRFDFSGVERPVVRWWYHMYGAQMGTLALDVHDGTEWTSNRWSISGQQQVSATSSWESVQLMLPELSGTSSARLRLRGVTGSGAQGDLAVDAVAVDEPRLLPVDAGFNDTASWLQWGVQVVSNNPAGSPPRLNVVNSGTNPVCASWEGDGLLQFNSYHTRAGSAMRLVSPLFSTRDTSVVDVQFKWHEDGGYANSSNEGVHVQWSTNLLDWHGAEFFRRHNPNLTSEWRQKAVRLPEEAADQEAIAVAFLFVSQWGNNCHLDDVHIIRATNVPPTNLALTPASVDEDAPIGAEAGILTVDNDDASSLFFELVSGPGDQDNGLFVLDGDRVLTDTLFDYPAKASFRIRVRATDRGGLGVESPFVITLNRTVTGPVGADDAYAAVWGGTLDIDAPGVLANDVDPDGLPLEAVQLAGPAHGNLTLNSNGSFSYEHSGGAAAYDSFTYRPVAAGFTGNTTTVRLNLLAAPGNLAASDGTYTNRVQLTWNSVANAAGYRVYRSASADFSAATVLSASNAATSYADYAAAFGAGYHYWVAAIDASGNAGPPSGPDTGFRGYGTSRQIPAWSSGSMDQNGSSNGTRLYGFEDKTFTDIINRAWYWWDTPSHISGHAVESASASSVGYSQTVVCNYWQAMRIARISAPYATWNTSRFVYSDAMNASAADRYFDWTSNMGVAYTVNMPLKRAHLAALPADRFGLAFATDDHDRAFVNDDALFTATAGNLTVSSAGSPGLFSPEQDENIPGGTTILLRWTPVLSANNTYLRYRIQISTVSSFSSTAVNYLTTTSTVTGVNWNSSAGYAWGHLHYWRVRIEDKDDASNTSAWSAVRSFRLYAPPAAPDGVEASDGAFPDRVRVNWNNVWYADSYRVYRSDTPDSAAAELLGETTLLHFDDRTGLEAETYFYWVEAGNAGGWSAFSPSASGYWGFAAPLGLEASRGTNPEAVELTWQPTSDATGYRVYRHTADDPGASAEIAYVSGVSCVDTSVAHNVGYYYWVRGDNGSAQSDFSASSRGCRGLYPPGDMTASAGEYDDRVELAWEVVDGAGDYLIYRGTTDDFASALYRTRLGSTAWADTAGIAGQQYTYWAVAANNVTTGQPGQAASGWRRLPPPANVQASDGTHDDRVRITWNTVPNATRYEVYRSLSDAEEAAVHIGDTSGTSFDDLNVTPSVTYYYRIAAGGTGGAGLLSASDSGYRANSGQLVASPVSFGSIRCRGGDVYFSDSGSYVGWLDASPNQEWRTYIWWSGATVPPGVAIEHAVIDYLGYVKVDYQGSSWGNPRGSRIQTNMTAFFNATLEKRFRDRDKLNVLMGGQRRYFDVTEDQGGIYYERNIPIDRNDVMALVDGTGFGLAFAADDTTTWWRNNSTKLAILSGGIIIETYGAPGLGTPLDGTRVAEGKPVDLRWHQVLNEQNWYLEYLVQVSESPTFATTNVEERVQAFGVPAAESTRLRFTPAAGSVQGKPLYWRVRIDDYLKPGNRSHWSATGHILVVKAPLEAAAQVTATDALHTDHIGVEWSAVTGAGGYAIYRGTNSQFASAWQIATAAGTSHADHAAPPHNTLYYWIAATNIGGTGPLAGPAPGRRRNSLPHPATNATCYLRQGETATITTNHLRYTDADDPDHLLAFHLLAPPAHGTLSVSGVVLAVSDSFPQAAIARGALAYQHGGSTAIADSFTFLVSDGRDETAPAAFTFSMNTRPEVAIHRPAPHALLLQYETVLLTASASDPEDGLLTNITWTTDAAAEPIAYGTQTTFSAWTPGRRTLTASVTDSGGATGTDQIIISVLADQFRTGLPDDWEFRYWPGGGSGGADNDYDNSGRTNYEEWLAGTDPLDPNSRFLLAPDAARPDIMRWNAVSGRVYTIFWTPDILTPMTDIVYEVVTEANGTLSYTGTHHQTESFGFYRIRVKKR